MENILQNKNYRESLNKTNLRATPARLAILQYLDEAKNPLDVNTIIDYLNCQKIKTNQATVFRIMNILTNKNIAIPTYFQDGKTRYELANKKHHHHLVCEKCGKIEDVEGDSIQSLEKEIGKEHKFLIKKHSLEFYGLCVGCK